MALTTRWDISFTDFWRKCHFQPFNTKERQEARHLWWQQQEELHRHSTRGFPTFIILEAPLIIHFYIQPFFLSNPPSQRFLPALVISTCFLKYIRICNKNFLLYLFYMCTIHTHSRTESVKFYWFFTESLFTISENTILFIK